MKYIKLFEYLNDISKYEISDEEFFSFIEKNDNFIFLDEKDKEFLSKYFGVSDIQYQNDRLFWSDYLEGEYVLKASIILTVDYDRFDIVVLKDEDDYYYIEIDNDYYKCDQRIEFKKLIANYLK